MSKELEALRRLHYGALDYCDKLLEDKIIDENHYRNNIIMLDDDRTLLQQALKRNEPVKVNSFDPSNHYGGLGYFKCPKCGEEITEGYYNYCPECGQALNWSSSNE